MQKILTEMQKILTAMQKIYTQTCEYQFLKETQNKRVIIRKIQK